MASDWQKDPLAQIGYVFLFFYGLERRVLTASLDSPQDVAELAVLNVELRRLLDIYGNQGSFASYASSLLDYLEVLQGHGLDLDKLPIPNPASLARGNCGAESRAGSARQGKEACFC